MRVTPRSSGFLLALGAGLALCAAFLASSASAVPSSSHRPMQLAATATETYRPPIVVTDTPVPPPPPTVTPSARHSAPRPSAPPGPPHPGPAPIGGVPNIGGQLILVSLAQQWLWAYQDRVLYYDTPVTTGMPQLPTPDGIFYIQFKETNITFYSPWPPGSPYYYSPEHINYALDFAAGGYFLHDAPWRHMFGPGTNYPHTDPDGTVETGSHGCVNMPTPAGQWLYNWAWNGAVVDIYGVAATGPTPTPSPTATPTSVPTATATVVPPTPTNTPVPVPTDTPTPTPAPADTPTPTATP